MILKSTSKLPFTSPLARIVGPLTAGALDADHSVGLTDLSGQILLHVQGFDATRVLQEMYNDVPETVGAVALTGDGALAHTTTDEFVLLAHTSESGDAVYRIHAVSKDALMTVTNITHGCGHMLLVGIHAADVLSKICGLDFADIAFPNLHATYSSLAKVRALVMRLDKADASAYHIIVDYSLAAYIWDVIFDAMGEFGGAYLS